MKVNKVERWILESTTSMRPMLQMEAETNTYETFKLEFGGLFESEDSAIEFWSEAQDIFPFVS